jgi:hypothetical protein
MEVVRVCKVDKTKHIKPASTEAGFLFCAIQIPLKGSEKPAQKYLQQME